MFDKWIRFISGRLDAYAAATKAQRARVEAELARDEARQHAGREFENAEGFTTPLPKAFENAQNVYARARRDFEACGGVKALMLFVAMLVAREKRDDAWTALKRHEEAEAEREDTGVHRYVKPHYADMFKRGVEPRHLADVREETRAIVADLIRWDGHDPDRANPDNPMRQVFGIYASRLILKPGQFGDKKRSVAGTPVAPKRHADPRHYRFDLLVHGAPAPDADEPPTGADPLPVAVESDGGDQEEPAMSQDVTADRAGVVDAAEHGQVDTNRKPATTPVQACPDEYALPAHLSGEDAAKLRRGALQLIQGDDEWDYELQAAARWFHGALPTTEIIARVDTTPDHPRSTPFRYFVDAARRGGLEAGRGAYREATIRRYMLEIATLPQFAQARANLGL